LPSPTHLEIVPLGGLGEFGMNLMVLRWGRDCVVVDAGMMFPGEEHLGVDVVIPDLSFLDDCGVVHGVLLSHGHEDHIGAVSYLLMRHDVPVFATPFTAGLVRHRLAEHGLTGRALRPLPLDGERVALGPFTVESLGAAHSIPQARMLVLRTPVGIVLHTADFKLDPAARDGSESGSGTDLERLAELGREGVLVLLADSTNADRPGSTPGERTVTGELERLVAGARRRCLVTTFASHIERIASLVRIAERHGRHVALVGSSLASHADVAEQLGLLRFPPRVRVPPEAAGDVPPERLLVVAAGSQGEPTSAMARIAVGKHRHVELGDGDLVIHSARRIPGNEKSIARLVNHLLRRGADVVTADDAPVHVSGHAASAELARLLALVRPRYLVPIHGEYKQLRAHARLAIEAGMDRARVTLADSGDVIAVDGREIGVTGRVHVGQVLIDAEQDEVDWTVVRDRRRIAGGGIVVPVVAVHRESGAVNGSPEIVARGFVPIAGESAEQLIRDARRVVADALADATPEERADEGLLRARIRTALRRFLRRRTQRQPLVIPVIVEL
jgi:ribonuclease J